MIKKMFIVGALKESLVLEYHLPNAEEMVFTCDIPCSWAEGMLGAFPAFAVKEDAEKYSHGVFNILEVDVEVPERQ